MHKDLAYCAAQTRFRRRACLALPATQSLKSDAMTTPMHLAVWCSEQPGCIRESAWENAYMRMSTGAVGVA